MDLIKISNGFVDNLFGEQRIKPSLPIKGKLQKGTAHPKHHYSNYVSSIPSRQQKVLIRKETGEESKAFGFQSRRFNNSLEHKMKFNRDAGPGTYKQNTVDEIVESSDKYTSKGFSRSFLTKDERFDEKYLGREKISLPGPGVYEAEPIKRKTESHSFALRSAYSLALNEKNPLNYIKPLTVNIYFKPVAPGPGQYNPIYEEVGAMKGARNVFESAVPREVFPETLKNEDLPHVGQYDPTNYTIEKEMERQKMTISSNFRRSTTEKRQKTNLYNPHDPKEKATDKKEDMNPGPGYYNPFDILQENAKKAQIPSNTFAESNKDRFGTSVMPRKPYEIVPGPGAYNPSDEQVNKKHIAASMPISERAPLFKTKFGPGPALYNPTKDTKKTTFMLNLDSKWVQ